MRETIDYNSIKDFYNKHTECWGNDLFSKMTTSFIDRYVNKRVSNLSAKQLVLNAGSGGKTYKTQAKQYQIDIAKNTIRNRANAIVGNIIDMPFKSNMFDVVICVGTVINYSEAEKAIKEFRRVSKDDAVLIIEYERSQSGLIKEPERGGDCILFRHSYCDEFHENYLYSDKYIADILSINGYRIEERRLFNTTIPYFEMFFSDPVAHFLTIFEPIFRRVNKVSKYSHNMILFCRLQK